MNALLLAGGASQAFPVITGVVARDRLTGARRWIVGWGVFSVVWTTGQYIASHYGPNLWMSYVSAPMEGTLLLMALSWWQERPAWRRAMHWTIVIAFAAHLAMTMLVENLRGFSIATMPFYALVGFAAALFTLISRSFTTAEPLARQDWFWGCAGIALYYGAYGVTFPLASAVRDNMTALTRIFTVFNVVGVLAYAIVAAGLLCPASRTGVVPAGQESSP